MEPWIIYSRVDDKRYEVKSVGSCIKCKSRIEQTCSKKYCENWIMNKIIERKINV